MLTEGLSTVCMYMYVGTRLYWKDQRLNTWVDYYNKDLGPGLYVCTRYGKDSLGQLKQLMKLTFSAILYAGYVMKED